MSGSHLFLVIAGYITSESTGRGIHCG
jgi:hypothetical protein